MEIEKPKQRKGFAVMDREVLRNIASRGGKVAHELGKAHEFTSEEAREAGRKGGISISKNREHMRKIGAVGGKQSRI